MDEILGTHNLVAERGLGAATAANYAAKTRPFLAALADRGPADLTAAEVAAFIS